MRRAPVVLLVALIFWLLPRVGWAQAGMPVGPEFRVNTYTIDGQGEAAVASNGAGSFVVVWQSAQDGSFYGVFGQRYNQIVPVELMRFGVE